MKLRRLLPILILPIVVAFAALLVVPEGRSERGTLWSEVLSGAYVPDETLPEDCAEASRRMPCFVQAFGNIAYRDGGAKAMRLLLEESAKSDGELADCHIIAHFVGSASYYGLKGDFAAAIAAGNRECSGGYYHGVVAAETVSNPPESPEAFGERIARLCRASSAEYVAQYECYHGIGHVAEHLYDYETPTALRACNAMRSLLASVNVTEYEELDTFYSCTQGVFMENRNAEGGPGGRWRRADDPAFPCLEFDEETGLSCWDVVPGTIERSEGETLIELAVRRFAACEPASIVSSWLERCRLAARRTAFAEGPLGPLDAVAICAEDPGGQAGCFRVIGEESVIRWSSPLRSESVCRGATGASERAACGEGIGSGLSISRLDKTRCDELAELLVESCRKGFDEAELVWHGITE